MKKILSVLLAVLMVSVAFAQSPLRIGARVAAGSAAPAKQTLEASSRNHSAGTHAAKATVDVTIASFTSQYYDEDNDWYYTINGTDGSLWHFDVVADEIVSGQTYTLDDMIFDYTWGSLSGAREDAFAFASCSFTYTLNGDGTESIVAQVVDSNSNIYNLHYATPSMDDATDTVDVNIVNAKFTDYTSVDGSFYFYGYTADSAITAQVNYYSTTVAGTYTFSDFYVRYCNVGFLDATTGQYAYTTTGAGNITVTEADGSYNVDAWLLSADLHCYHVTMSYTIPVATDTVDVIVPLATYESVPASWYADASQNWTGASSDATYDVEISYASEVVEGDYAFIAINTNSNISGVTFVDGHLSVASNDEGYELEAYLIGEDLHCYHITMNYHIPTMDDAIDTVSIDIPAAMLTDLTVSNGVFQLRGYTVDSTYYATVAAYSSQIAGSYEYADFYTDYTLVYDVALENQIRVLAGHATVSATAVGYSLDAYLLGADLHCYHVTMTYSTPVAADTVEVVIPSATFSDYSDYDGSYQFIGASEDSTYEVGFNYFSSTITGSFTWADCDASYSGLYVNGTSLSVYSAEFTVTEVEGGYQVEAYVLCTDNHCYHVMMFYSAEGINTANQVQVKVYPNPAADMLHVEADGIVRIDVIDAAGRIVLSNTRNVNTLNISGLSNGVYMLRTATTEGVNVQKIIKK